MPAAKLALWRTVITSAPPLAPQSAEDRAHTSQKATRSPVTMAGSKLHERHRSEEIRRGRHRWHNPKTKIRDRTHDHQQ